ncbi:hypothetical protein AB0L88_09375 [Saccharopolyspora shandongensis]|uniref:hypothetical protein n=1 Tax=Saccharopolyspora shandongensis TaxID=418495 RepID=UPI00342DDECF
MQVRCSFSLLVRLSIWLVVLALAASAALAAQAPAPRSANAPDAVCSAGKEVC